jgi:hypothetical protein
MTTARERAVQARRGAGQSGGTDAEVVDVLATSRFTIEVDKDLEGS